MAYKVATCRKSPTRRVARATATLIWRSVFLIIAVLTYGLTAGMNRAAFADAPTWVGTDVRRISRDETARLAKELPAFFGKSEGHFVSDALIPGMGPLLLDQFAAVDYGFIMEEYRLPGGRLIWDRYDAHSGVDAIVISETTGSADIAATAFLTHLCPKNGVDETFNTTNGRSFTENFRCELDYSLIVLYAHGAAPNPRLDLDLTKWAQANIEARDACVVPSDRKLLLKNFVRVLGDRPIDLSVVDSALPLNFHVPDSLRSLCPG